VKRGFVILALAVGVAALALGLSFRGEKLPLPSPGDWALPSAHPPADMTLSTLPTGAMPSVAAFAFRGGGFGDARDFAMTAILVHHPRGDLLFDTGFGRGVDRHARAMPWLMKVLSSYRKATPAADQLATAGYDPARLAGVVLTHAHWDHVSGLPDMPGVPVWVVASERAFLEARSPSLARDLGALAYRIYAFDGGPYLGFAKSLDVWGDGSVVLVPAPGHTPGSVVAFVTLPSGARYALLGDLVWLREGVEIPAERPWLTRVLVDDDPGAVRENIEHVAAIHARFPEIRLIPAHDARALGELPRFPAVAH